MRTLIIGQKIVFVVKQRDKQFRLRSRERLSSIGTLKTSDDIKVPRGWRVQPQPDIQIVKKLLHGTTLRLCVRSRSIHQYRSAGNLAQRENAMRRSTPIPAHYKTADQAFKRIHHICLPLAANKSRISCLATFQRGMSILVPTTSTTLAAIIEPALPHISSGMPREWA